MPADEKPQVNRSRIYTFSEVRAQFGVDTNHLLRMAMQAEIKLCVSLPPCTRAYVIDTRTVNVEHHEAAIEKMCDPQRKPDPVNGKPRVAPSGVAAMIVDANDCRRVANLGRISLKLFSSAYLECGNPSVLDGSDIEKYPYLPVRFPLFSADGSVFLDQFRSRLAIYPDPYKFRFRVGVGYQSPLPISISTVTLSIVGRELETFISRESEISAEEKQIEEKFLANKIVSMSPFPVSIKPAPKITPSLATEVPGRNVPSGINAIYKIAADTWMGVVDEGEWALYDALNHDSVVKIQEKIDSQELNLRPDQVAAIAALIRPGWAIKNEKKSIKILTRTDLSLPFARLLEVAKKMSNDKVKKTDWGRVELDLTSQDGVGSGLTGSQALAAIRLLKSP